MNLNSILQLLQSGDYSIEEAKNKILIELSNQHMAELSYANLDLEREKRTGFPEVIYGEGKTIDQIIQIIRKLQIHTDRILATRISKEKAEQILVEVPEVTYHPLSRIITWFKRPIMCNQAGYIAVVCAGTADVPVAEEAAITLQCMGNKVETIYDVGVAGIHRLFKHLRKIQAANVIIVVAGMEGALVSVIGGLVSKPIIAVPTSTGYGTHLGGITPLLTMLNSCSAGVTVVNIDNGFGAAYSAGLINRQIQR